ncbi:GerA spore germination protein [Seinonella peptonophila]|uniref:GerA spore germination protein n=1 Tax=Seinonella peptonophila TaxID=112248 RepID=A0A1M5BAB0_9BACL|nr:spore germination protein [Seinonella peptonophila]SHF39439.1 GerA spore germination protein [Seinonella peptonophila]
MKKLKDRKTKMIDKDTVFTWFKGCTDVVIENTMKDDDLLLYCKTLVDKKELRYHIIPRLEQLTDVENNEQTDALLTQSLKLDDSISDQIIQKVFEGNLIIVSFSRDCVFSIEADQIPHRSVEQPITESTIKGARDGFVEELETNLGLIRKRIKTTSLKIKRFVIGKRNKTKLALLFLDDVIPTHIIHDISKRLDQIDTDGIVSSSQIEELLHANKPQIFPLLDYSGRPDYAMNCLLYGRFVILVDGSPTAIMGPVSLPFLLNAGEDQHVGFFFGSFERLVRYLGLIASLLLPGFWIALITHHPDQLPYTLLATYSLTRQGIPFPPILEGFLILLLFDLLREAGLRLPAAFGQTLSIVGGLIIGQASISAGIASPGIIVVVAISVISTFVIINQALVGAVNVIRIFIYLASALMGLVGFFSTLFFLIIYLVNLKSFQLPYLTPISPPYFTSMIPSFFRSRFKKMNKRPRELQTIDSTRRRKQE